MTSGKNHPKQQLKRIIFNFWLVRILISIVLYFSYRIAISNTNHVEGSFLENVLQFLNILLDLAYSFVYLLTILFCSLLIFLNYIAKIRNNFYLSLLTILGIPVFCVIFITINVIIDTRLYSETALGNLLNFSIIYLLLATLEFAIFRRVIKRKNYL